MKKIFRKNQLIITAMAALIAVAGYLNYTEKNTQDNTKQTSSGNLQGDEVNVNADTNENNDEAAVSGEETEDNGKNDTEQVAGDDIASNEVEMEGTPGEAVFVNAAGTVDFIVEAKLAKEYVRVSSQEMLQEIVDSTTLSSEEKQAAVDKMVELTDISEREMAAESLIMAKGYSDVSVTMTDGYVDVIIVAEDLDMTQRAQIEDIVKRKMQVDASKITINAIEVDKTQ